MSNNDGIDGTFYKLSLIEDAEKRNYDRLTEWEQEVYKYIRENRIVTGKSIRMHWVVDVDSVANAIENLLEAELVIKILTQKQVEEFQLQGQGWVMSEAEARRAKMQELVVEIHTLEEEYSRKRRELNRIFEKQEKARVELTELTKVDYLFYHGGN